MHSDIGGHTFISSDENHESNTCTMKIKYVSLVYGIIKQRGFLRTTLALRLTKNLS